MATTLEDRWLEQNLNPRYAALRTELEVLKKEVSRDRYEAGYLNLCITNALAERDAYIAIWEAACTECEVLRAKVRDLEAKYSADSLFELIRHGDTEHQAWLRAKADEFFTNSADHQTP